MSVSTVSVGVSPLDAPLGSASFDWRSAMEAARGAGDIAAMERACRYGMTESPQDWAPRLSLSEILLATGQVQDAIVMLSETAARHPTVAPIFTTLALAALGFGDEALALRSVVKASEVAPDDADVASLHGELLLQLERPQEALVPLRRATRLRSHDGMAWANLGLALSRTRQDTAADQAFAQARANLEDPDLVATASAEVLGRLGRVDEAVQLLVRAIERKPSEAELWGELGNALARADRWSQAVTIYVRALELAPEQVPLRLATATALEKVGQPEQSITMLQNLLLQPDLPTAQKAWAWDLVGVAKLALADKEGAVAAFETALQLDGGPSRYHAHLAAALLPRQAGRAQECLTAAISRDAEARSVFLLLGNALKEQGRIDEAQEAYREALRRHPDHADAHSNLVYSELFRSDVTPARVLGLHRTWQERHLAGVSKLPELPSVVQAAPDAPLRIGLVSSDLRSHPVGYFTVRTIEALAQDGVEVVVYTSQRADSSDPLTRRFVSAARVFRNSAGASDDDLAAAIRSDGIDVLVDLAGHCAGHRLPAFARRPSPVQVSWAGYMATTGVSAIDVLIADRHHVPEGDERHYVERVVRMPDAFVAYDPPSPLPDVRPPPSMGSGVPTFGAFHILAKVTDEVLAVWRELLDRVPAARLLWKTTALDCPQTQQWVRSRLRAAGIDPSRVELRGHSGLFEHMEAISEVDVALDSFPFSGSTTTLETMLMGVPVVTWPRSTFSSRHSLAFLTTVGLTDTIARSAEEYIQIAVEWANDPARLGQLRSTLRRQMLHSAMCDGVSHARAFKASLIECRRRGR